MNKYYYSIKKTIDPIYLKHNEVYNYLLKQFS